jgi:hypothetical protein
MSYSVSVARLEIEAVLIQLEHVGAFLLCFLYHFLDGGGKPVGKSGVDFRYWHAARLIQRRSQSQSASELSKSFSRRSTKLAAVTVSKTPFRTFFCLAFPVMNLQDVTNS